MEEGQEAGDGMSYWIMVVVIYAGGVPIENRPVSMWYNEVDCRRAAHQLMEHEENKRAVVFDCIDMSYT